MPCAVSQFRVSKDAATPQRHFRRSTIAVEDNDATFDRPQEQRDTQPVSLRTFDEALAASKLLQPPVSPGDTGNHFYTTQPFQLLSWYPRYSSAAAVGIGLLLQATPGAQACA